MPVYFTDGRKGLVLIEKDIAESSYLMHYRTPGSKNGVRKYQYEDGSLTPLGYIHYGIGKGRKSGQKYEKSDKVFVSGKVKYDKPLSGKIKREVKNIMKANSKILVGDAPGADTRVQEYLKKKRYQNVEVFTTDKEARNNVGGWKVNKIDASKYQDEREARAQKDIAMAKSANKGLAISSEDDRPDSATSQNIKRMQEQGSSMAVYDYKTKRFINKQREVTEADKKTAEETGKTEANNRIKTIESLEDGPEKTKALDLMLKDCDDYTKKTRAEIQKMVDENHISYTKARSIFEKQSAGDPKDYETNSLESWLFSEIVTKSGDWYGNEGVSKGFKAITDAIKSKREEKQKIHDEIYSKYGTDSYEKIKNNTRLTQIDSEINKLHDKIPEQVLRDLGFTVSNDNIERIKPFVFWD